ncbi:reverse transcriptase [Thalictrum thalictroides]|uniref:Reverse transcriptase n=1 Tax=Thalictrum thalictroides TaxID=46969 RepID=A0A7J6WP54_THATH|nr:reverse transcriptase [Thalictrum thalictroides]
MARSRVVSDELLHHCLNDSIDVALVQEPYALRGVLHGLKYRGVRIVNSTPNEHHGIWAAIVVFNSELDIVAKPHLTSTHTVVLGVSHPGQEPIDLVSSYFQFRKPTESFTVEITRTHASLLARSILCMDVNAFSTKWHDHRTNEKGRLVEDMIGELGLVIINKAGNEHTFQGARGRSNVDLTLASPGITNNILDWRVTKGITSSDHLVISFTISDHIIDLRMSQNTRYLDRKIDKPKLIEAVKNALSLTRVDGTINGQAEQISLSLKSACDRVLPKSSSNSKQRPPWWNAEVTLSRRELKLAHRTMIRLSTPESRDFFKTARNKHVSTIRKAKKAVWRKFAEDPLTSNPWGNLTKWLIKGPNENPIPSVLRKNDGSYTTCVADTVSYMMEELIPSSAHDPAMEPANLIDHNPPQITIEELTRVISKQKNSAPGADGLSARIIKAAWPAFNMHMLHLVNNCLKSAKFPDTWKEAKIVVLLKSKDKDPLIPKSYRPVSLLPVLGKILEEVICDILEQEVGNTLCPDQHGFRPGKSTSTALNEVQEWTSQNGRYVLGSFLDISGAFDNVRWPVLINDMQSLRCSPTIVSITKSYLAGRSAIYRIGGSEHSVKLTRGCPQGSKLGPRLWNVSMNPLFGEAYPEDTKIVAYADDIALLVAGDSRREIILKSETALRTIAAWAGQRGLKFSKEKSVMIPLKGGLVPGFTAEFVDGRIRSVQESKYLGLHLSEGFNFHNHALKLLESSKDVFSRLKSIRKSKWGASSALSLILYKAVYIPRIMYGSKFWYPSINGAKDIAKLESAQRRVLMAVTGAYNTASTRALQVLAGTPPLHLHIQAVIRTSNGMSKSDSEDILITQWQALWSGTTKGRWTFEFLPNIRERTQIPITFDHYTAQMVTGHGDFNGKLHGFNLTEAPGCSCGHEYESAEHVLYHCSIFEDLRTTLRESLERSGIAWPCSPSVFSSSSSSWSALEKFARNALIRKENSRTEERIRLREENEQDI